MEWPKERVNFGRNLERGCISSFEALYLESAGGDEEISGAEVGQMELQVVEDAVPHAALRGDGQTQAEVESLGQRRHQPDLHPCMNRPASDTLASITCLSVSLSHE